LIRILSTSEQSHKEKNKEMFDDPVT